MIISEVLRKYYPDIEWVCNANDYEQLEVHSNHEKPTKKDLEEKWDEMTDSGGKIIKPPTPEEAKDKVEELLVQAYTDNGSDTPKMDANEMLDNYPSIYRHLDNGDYQFTVDYVRAKIEPKESIVTTAMIDELETFLQLTN